VSGERSRPSTIAIIVVVVVALVAGALIVRRWTSKRPDTLVVGDSVTFLSATPIQQRLGASHVQLIALPGYRSLDIYPHVKDVLDQHRGPSGSRKRSIFLVGYNDVMRNTVDSDVLGAMLKQADGFECSVWLTLPVRPGGARAQEPRYDPDRATQWNERVVRLAKAYPHVHVSDAWADAVEAKGAHLLQADGVHPNADGQQRLGDVMRSSLDDAC